MARSNVKLSVLMWRDLFVRYASQGQNLQNQIRAMIVDAILDGRLPAGSEVPSSRELSEALGVARNTVVLAYQQLVSKGYLLTRDRSAHLVNPEMVKPGVGDKPVSEKASLPEGGYRTGSLTGLIVFARLLAFSATSSSALIGRRSPIHFYMVSLTLHFFQPRSGVSAV